jgi:hypothetical protein
MRITILLLTAFLFSAPALEQAGPTRVAGKTAKTPPKSGETGEFTFVRTIYSSPFGGRRWSSWATDYPEADYHFISGIRLWSTTNLSISSKPEQIAILDGRLFNYPLIYFVEPGYMSLSDEEAGRLREYAARGGMLFLDDFWGDYEWENVRHQMQMVFPKRSIQELPLSHPLFHAYFDIEEVVQVPGIGAWLGWGVTYEKGGIVPHYMGIEDEKGRLVAFITRNCDLGDAWEWINDPRYPVKYGLAAYRLGINVIMYAMSH